MNKNLSICVIGAGHLGMSILNQLHKRGHKVLWATRRSHERLSEIRQLVPGINVTTDNLLAIKSSEVIIVATKEHNFLDFASDLKNNRSGKFIISMGPTYSLKKLGSIFGSGNARLVPPIDPLEDVLCYSLDEHCGAREKEIIQYIFKGTLCQIQDFQMPMATSYVLFRVLLNSFFEPLQNAGKKVGFDEEFIQRIVGKMLISAGQEIELGISSRQRLEQASGGFNEKSFTLNLYNDLKPLQNQFEKLFNQTYSQLKNLEQ